MVPSPGAAFERVSVFMARPHVKICQSIPDHGPIRSRPTSRSSFRDSTFFHFLDSGRPPDLPLFA